MIAVGALGLAGPAHADTASPTTPADSAATAGGPDGRAPLTPEQVRAQLAKAAELQAELSAFNEQLGRANATVAQLASQSSALMDQVAAAKAAEDAARAEEAAQLKILHDLSQQAIDAAADVNQLAYDAYVNGSGSLRDVAAIVQLATQGQGGPASASLADYLAESRAADEDKYSALAKLQQVAATRAAELRKQREAATAKATAAQAEAAAALQAQQKALAELQSLSRSKSAELAALGLPGLGAGVDLASISDLTSGPLCREDNPDYPNGRFPRSALCPIDGAPGHMMRPAAARALNALKAAYRKDFGKDLCITDTYRTYEQQVDVKARKGKWAATPGTSNHGWGLATDLCGGIENFGTVQHRWMKQHAALFGYFHPSWAEPSGSLPEPWHWEYVN
jgi:chemotaxis protein histidine kinase CheA